MKTLFAFLVAVSTFAPALAADVELYSPRAPWIGCGLYGGWRC